MKYVCFFFLLVAMEVRAQTAAIDQTVLQRMLHSTGLHP
jgi:hypothetical protein